MSPHVDHQPELIPMAIITVQVWDIVGNRKTEVELPDDQPVSRILDVLVEKMGLPQIAPDGLPSVYEFHHKRSGKLLLGDQCLQEVGVKDDDVLRLPPQIPRRTPSRIW
jgi:uncharacterized ubiquitin-like protein YukD